MQATDAGQDMRITLDQIKELGTSTGPCVSILVASETAPDQQRRTHVRLRQALAQARERLTARLLPQHEIDDLIAKLDALVEASDFSGKGAALYGSPSLSRIFHVPVPVGEEVCVGDHFYVVPLIPALNADQVFYILALSQKHARLLRCTERSSEEVELPPGAPVSIRGDADTDQPDHLQANLSTGGPHTGSMKGVQFTTSSDAEAHQEYLAHFYKHLSESVTELLRAENAPLVIAGVEYELASFRRVNVYPHLVEEGVRGAADGLKGGELHRRALEAMQTYWNTPLQAALKRYDESGLERRSSTLKEIVKAAWDGRVLDLVVAQGARYMGHLDEATHDVKGHKLPSEDDEDLLNVAVLQAILHSGQVFVVPPSQVPHGAPAIAVYRW